jgi:predicted metal-binding protein
MEKLKIGIIICDRYHTCSGGKCLHAFHNRKGAFKSYADKEIELVGYTTCNGCPGGNIEYAPDEMVKNGVDVIHLATGMVVGYPPCPRINYFKKYIENKYNIEVVVGTHPIPEKYYKEHVKHQSWASPAWKDLIDDILVDEQERLSYN